jgi:peroxiredoxin
MAIIGILLPWLLIAIGCYLFLLLARQNGRIVLRLEAIEERLDELTDSGIYARDARNGHRPLSASKIERNGLQVGTPAPHFKLPRIESGELTLSEYKGKRVLLVFSDPHCGPCDALAPDLEKAAHQNPTVQVLMVSRGEIAENRKKAKQHGLTFPVVLQKKWEISKLYGMFATPVGYLIDEEGKTLADVAVGADAILGLLHDPLVSVREPKPVD